MSVCILTNEWHKFIININQRIIAKSYQVLLTVYINYQTMEATTTTLVSLPKFDGKAENWPKHKRSAIVSCKSASPDPHGLLPEMLGAVEFHKVTNENINQFSEYVHPGPEPAKPLATASKADKAEYATNFDVWYKQDKRYSDHIRCSNKFKETFFHSLDEASQTAIDISEYGIVNMQLSVMYELVDKMFSVITPTVYQRGIEALYVDYNPSHVTMRQHFSNHVSCHSFALNSSGEEITKVEKVRLLRNSVFKCGLFQVAIDEYDRQFKSIKHQNFNDLSALLIQVDQSLAQSKIASVTTQSLGYSAEVAKLSNSRIEEDLENRIAAAVTKAVKSSKASGAEKKPNTNYCHTHGIEANHTSDTCKFPIEGHRTDATLTRKLGGRETKWKKKNY